MTDTNTVSHINPEQCGAEKLSATVAVTGEVMHKLMNWSAIHSNGLEHLDGKDWEVFNVSHMGEHNGITYVWGMFLEGIGAFNVMVPVKNVRNLLESEKKHWRDRPMVMVGSHTGKESYGFTAHIGKELAL
jgi:hypothetical protein